MLLNAIDSRPVAVLGNYIAFPKALPAPVDGIDPPRSERVVILPTRGLFAETQLSHCNCCEERDITRFWDWSQSPCPEKPPEITGITPGPKGQPIIVTPSTLPNSLINIVNPPTAPDPSGLAAALNVLGTAIISS